MILLIYGIAIISLINVQDYDGELPQYSPPGLFEDDGLPLQPNSLRLTPHEIMEMQKIVEDLDMEDQREKNKLKATLETMQGTFRFMLALV